MAAFGACLFLLAAALAIGLIGFALTLAICLALRDFVPAIVLIVASFPLWCGCSLGVAWLVGFGQRKVEERRRQRLLQRDPLDDEEFCRHFEADLRGIASAVREEVGRRIGKAEVAGRLGPTDPIRVTCGLMSVTINDIDWVELLAKLEQHYGAQVPDALLYGDATFEQLVSCLAGKVSASSASQQRYT